MKDYNHDHHKAASIARAKLDRPLVEHLHFDRAFNQIRAALLYPTDSKFLWIIGPTGVGKTRLKQAVEKLIREIMEERMASDPGMIPYVSFEVPSAASARRFSWREFYDSYLEQLEAPITLNSITPGPLPLPDKRHSRERIVINAIKHRRPIATLLDEANHFASAASSKVLLENLTQLKSFANRTGILHICFGTYELAKLSGLSGQLARRCDQIHFPRYLAASREDCHAFTSAAKRFQSCVPVAHHLNLGSQANYLHQRTIGNVGVLKTWLMKALGHAHSQDRHEISMVDLKATEIGINKLRTMLAEAQLGEAYFRENQQELELFIETVSSSQTPPTPDDPSLAAEDSPKGPKRRPFTRKPGGDPVGGAFDELDLKAS